MSNTIKDIQLHLSKDEPKIQLVCHQNSEQKDVTYDTLLLTGAFISMFHDGAITLYGQDGKPIFDMTVQYHHTK